MRNGSTLGQHSLETNSGVVAPDHPPLPGCALCRRLGEVRDDVTLSFSRADRVASSAEAIVDAFGFCAEHGPSLVHADTRTGALRAVLLAAIERTIDLLGNEARNAERLQELCFNADAACPACRLREHDVTHMVRAAAGSVSTSVSCEPLCFPHYRQIAYALDSSALPALARSQLTVLRKAAELVKTLARDVPEWNGEGDAWDERLRAAIAVVAGDQEYRAVAPQHALAEEPLRMHDTGGCPVCAAMRDAHANWLAAVRSAARLVDDAWIVFPTCARHTWECARLGNAQLALKVAGYGTAIATQIVERGIAMVDDDNEKRRIAAQSVWYRRQSPAYILGQQRKMVTRLARCPGCERSVVAREGAVTSLARGLRRAAAGRALARTRELCLKHFAAVYLLLPPDEMRRGLLAVQRERLQHIHTHLAADSASAVERTSSGTALYDAVRCLSSCA